MEDQNEPQDAADETAEQDSIESSVFRVLDASRKSAFEEDSACICARYRLRSIQQLPHDE